MINCWLGRGLNGLEMRQSGIIWPMTAPLQPNALERDKAADPHSVQPETASRLAALESSLNGLGGLMVAYSGGVDSAFLAATAHRVLGARMLAVLADSPSLARRDF